MRRTGLAGGAFAAIYLHRRVKAAAAGPRRYGHYRAHAQVARVRRSALRRFVTGR